jgi:tetrahydromethanopterin S-methyltransferase subunit B
MMEKMDDDKVGYEMSKINETIQKFEELGNEIKKKGSSKVP